jgi:hypothetical protein
LDGGGWWEPISLKAAICVGGSIRTFDAINAQHRQATAELQQFFPAENTFCFGASCHNRILADSLFVRQCKMGLWEAKSRDAKLIP